MVTFAIIIGIVVVGILLLFIIARLRSMG